MKYTVNPVEHQPQWPVKHNKPKPFHSSKVVLVVGIAMFVVIGFGICALGLSTMMVAP